MKTTTLLLLGLGAYLLYQRKKAPPVPVPPAATGDYVMMGATGGRYMPPVCPPGGVATFCRSNNPISVYTCLRRYAGCQTAFSTAGRR